MCKASFCTTIGHPRHLSDHRPLSFGFRIRTHKKHAGIPAWVVSDTCFESHVKESLQFLRQEVLEESGADPSPAVELDLLKKAIREAAKLVQSMSTRKMAQTTNHKLAVTLSFIRAIESDGLAHARMLQSRLAL